MPAVLNAANEVAVEAFLARRIGISQIADVTRAVITAHERRDASSTDVIVAADASARAEARHVIAGSAGAAEGAGARALTGVESAL